MNERPRENNGQYGQKTPTAPEAGLDDLSSLAALLPASTEDHFDVRALNEALNTVGMFAPTLADEGTLNGMFDGTKVQFLDASSQQLLEPTTQFGGVRVASLADMLATKLKVIQRADSPRSSGTSHSNARRARAELRRLISATTEKAAKNQPVDGSGDVATP